MKIETILTPAELPALAQHDLRATACVVFDVLRATSTFVTALHNGAKGIIPISEISEALEIKNSEARSQKPELILLGGERDGVKIRVDGIVFDFGNSPREYTKEKVAGKTIVSTTTNGTRAFRACANAKTVLAASFLNLTATAKFLQLKNFDNVLLVCAGTGENKADEDVLAAGALCELLGDLDLECGDVSPLSKAPTCRRIPNFSDSTQIARRAWLEMKPDLAAAISNSENARRLLAIPELREDVVFCLQRDTHPLIAKMDADGTIRSVSGDRLHDAT
ncbi:MAG TPA: 2-phosphosulfolactate phosphatase [Methylomirabilota bacterium]|nr:2-phosphosulfolactate phosphatase [Methylomirabilota bacterium]